MNGESLNILKNRLEKLKADFPEIFTEGKIDIEKFKATFTDDINFNNERYVLNWAGKSDAFKALQIPTTATLKPQPEESVNFDTTENIFIEGENLEVLKVLQKSYYGKIKCIIIDPPYNTGNDSFIYPDSFKENKADYEKRIGDKDEEGYLMKEGMFRKNSKDSGHYHSNWLSMMYPRLFLAKNLLREDGVIFVHIDDNEVHNLRMIMNEIFGEENYITSIMWKRKKEISSDSKNVAIQGEYILAYAKSNLTTFRPELISQEYIEKSYNDPTTEFPLGKWRPVPITVSKGLSGGGYQYEITTPSGKKHNRLFAYPFKSYEKLIQQGRIYFGKNNDGIPQRVVYDFESKGQPTTNYWDSVASNKEGKKEVLELFQENLFDTPKPTALIIRLLKLTVADDDLILDFFSGSSSTAHAIMKFNVETNNKCNFIMVQLPELCDDNSEASKAGYRTIADISKERIRRAMRKIEAEQTEEQKKKFEQIDFGGKEAKKPLDLGFKAFKLSPSNFKIWRGNEINEENLVQQLDAFTNPVREGSEQENMLYELILKAGYSLTDKVEKIDNFYSIKDNELIIATDKISQVSIDKIIALKPKKVISLDILFKDNDQLKTNTVLQMKDAGVDFKTI
ncbi:MAG TPA: site-specific DNA-methyltransferase [Edaphocola sp.]|nr:site-specific DNA-methyltransferase [Edaphocola sp.]